MPQWTRGVCRDSQRRSQRHKWVHITALRQPEQPGQGKGPRQGAFKAACKALPAFRLSFTGSGLEHSASRLAAGTRTGWPVKMTWLATLMMVRLAPGATAQRLTNRLAWAFVWDFVD